MPIGTMFMTESKQSGQQKWQVEEEFVPDGLTYGIAEA